MIDGTAGLQVAAATICRHAAIRTFSPRGNLSTPTSFRIIDLPIETAARLWPAFLREARGNRLRVDVRRKPARDFLVIQRLTALVRHR
jgi:hypothetical protein